MMEPRIVDVNELVDTISGAAMRIAIDDEIWGCYGYSRIPRRAGGIWNKMMPQQFKYENFLATRIIAMGVIDLLNAIKESNQPHREKIMLMMGVIDKCGHLTSGFIQSIDAFFEIILSTYACFTQLEKHNLHQSLLPAANAALNDSDYNSFLRGTTKLISIVPEENFLLDRTIITGIVDAVKIANKLDTHMPRETFAKYFRLVETQVLLS